VSTMTPRLAEILARMVEAVLAAEDAVAGRGNIADYRDPAPQGPIVLAGRKRHTGKEATR